LCVGLKTREERLLGEEDALGGGLEFFLFFKLRDTTNNNGDIEFDLEKKVL
jgi:hypothetical protein